MRGDFGMLNVNTKKKGYTLVEVLVVVSIMGILSAMGVSSLTGAVANARIRDAALNTTAFLERIANDANRMSKTLCVTVENPQTLIVHEDDCDGDEYSRFAIEAPAKFNCNIDGDVSLPNWATTHAVFEPRIGLSAAPRNGFLCIQYGSREIYGRAWKDPTKNAINTQWKHGALSFWIPL